MVVSFSRSADAPPACARPTQAKKNHAFSPNFTLVIISRAGPASKSFLPSIPGGAILLALVATLPAKNTPSCAFAGSELPANCQQNFCQCQQTLASASKLPATAPKSKLPRRCPIAKTLRPLEESPPPRIPSPGPRPSRIFSHFLTPFLEPGNPRRRISLRGLAPPHIRGFLRGFVPPWLSFDVLTFHL